MEFEGGESRPGIALISFRRRDGSYGRFPLIGGGVSSYYEYNIKLIALLEIFKRGEYMAKITRIKVVQEPIYRR